MLTLGLFSRPDWWFGHLSSLQPTATPPVQTLYHLPRNIINSIVPKSSTCATNCKKLRNESKQPPPNPPDWEIPSYLKIEQLAYVCIDRSYYWLSFDSINEKAVHFSEDHWVPFHVMNIRLQKLIILWDQLLFKAISDFNHDRILDGCHAALYFKHMRHNNMLVNEDQKAMAPKPEFWETIGMTQPRYKMEHVNFLVKSYAKMTSDLAPTIERDRVLKEHAALGDVASVPANSWLQPPSTKMRAGSQCQCTLSRTLLEKLSRR